MYNSNTINRYVRMMGSLDVIILVLLAVMFCFWLKMTFTSTIQLVCQVFEFIPTS